jgi:hypothetical protein
LYRSARLFKAAAMAKIPEREAESGANSRAEPARRKSTPKPPKIQLNPRIDNGRRASRRVRTSIAGRPKPFTEAEVEAATSELYGLEADFRNNKPVSEGKPHR